LNNIRLGGGYRFESDTEAANNPIDKISYIRSNADQMIEALKNQDLNASLDVYPIEFVHSEKEKPPKLTHPTKI
jgi:hypothetical protein